MQNPEAKAVEAGVRYEGMIFRSLMRDEEQVELVQGASIFEALIYPNVNIATSPNHKGKAQQTPLTLHKALSTPNPVSHLSA